MSVRLVRLAGLALVGVLGIAVAGCGSGEPEAAVRRDGASVAARDADTAASLVTPLAGDSLLGAARGAGGVATLRTECASCHPAAHDAPLGRGPDASASCDACHATAHEPVQALYAGALRGPAIHPDTMFLARVACAGCHADTTFAATGAARLAAMDRMCTTCHGTRFTGMLARWRTGVAWRTAAVSAYVERAAADPRLAGAEPARARVRAARQTLALLNSAGALHNVRGADRLFRLALDNTAGAYARAGVAAPGRPALGPDPARVSCSVCHYGVETARVAKFGETFDHASHVVRADIACAKCHTDANYLLRDSTETDPRRRTVNPRHGKTTLTAASCDGCHHAPTQALACTACHAGDTRLGLPIRVTMPLRLTPKGAPATRAVPFSHAEHGKTACASCHTARAAVRTTAACASCHEPHHREARGCTTCHSGDARGTELRAAHKTEDHLGCASCHARETVALLTPDRTFCVSCHAEQADHKKGRECAPCHMQSTPPELKRRILSR